MQELINRVAKTTGLDAHRAEKAIGITLALIKGQGNCQKVDELFVKLPGAEELAAKYGDAVHQKSGFLGALGGLAGGPLAAVSNLKAAGLTMGQIKTLGVEVLAYAKEKAGPEIVREVAGSIPGLSGYV